MRIALAALLGILGLAGPLRAQHLAPEQLDTCRVYTDLSVALANADQVYALDLTRQKLREFPEEIYLLRNLNSLILDRNKLSELPERVSELRYLQVLSAERNRLEYLPDGICRLDSLRHLRMGDNEITRIPEDIGDCRALESILLWSNLVGFYPRSLADLKRLQTLDLMHVQMNEEEQDYVRSLLPEARIVFSPPCDCTFEDPWDVPEDDE